MADRSNETAAPAVRLPKISGDPESGNGAVDGLMALISQAILRASSFSLASRGSHKQREISRQIARVLPLPAKRFSMEATRAPWWRLY